MRVKCEKCGVFYDDEFRWTICPHPDLSEGAPATEPKFEYKPAQMIVGEGTGKGKPTFVAFPDDGYIALDLPREMFGPLPPGASGHLLRFKSSEGFRNFMVAAMETAALVWPDIAKEWAEGDVPS